MDIRWLKIVSNEVLCNVTNHDAIALKIQRRNGEWIGHTFRKSESTIEA